MTAAEELDSVRQAYMDAFNAGDADRVAALDTLEVCPCRRGWRC
jgi:hypothetical protein